LLHQHGSAARSAPGRTVLQVSASAAMPSVIIGGGRIGTALEQMGDGRDVIVRRGQPFPEHMTEGPIYVCTRNDVLDDIVAMTPENRREDLVFMQNGMLEPWLAAKGLEDNTQCLIYMAVAKLGDQPTDGITDLNPEGLTAATGKWATEVQTRLAAGSMSCKVLDMTQFRVSMFEKLIWICAFMHVGARHPGATVGDVEASHTEEVEDLIHELVNGTTALEGVRFDHGVVDRLKAYARSVAHFPTAVKELQWRNGYFHSLSKREISRGNPDPFPLHTAGLVELKVVRPFPKFALLFDCDGVIVETEELHRLAYNESFSAFDLKIDGVPVEWTVDYYDILQNTVGGGKPKMKWHFGRNGWPTSKDGGVPASEAEQDALVDALQDRKTEAYKRIVESTAEARPGVLRLMDEALDREDVAVAICSAATKAGFLKVVNSIVGQERLARFDQIIAGDDVPRKKPDPLIYNLVRERLGVTPDKCVVVEDSLVGLRAAKSAHMKCIITPTSSNSTPPDEFMREGAEAVVDVLGDSPPVVTAADLFPAYASEPVIAY